MMGLVMHLIKVTMMMIMTTGNNNVNNDNGNDKCYDAVNDKRNDSNHHIHETISDNTQPLNNALRSMASSEIYIVSKWVSVVLRCKAKKKTYQILWKYFHPAIRRYIIKFTVYPKKYTHGFRFAVLCCGYTLTDFPISIRLTSLALWQSNDCPSASKATLMNMDRCFMWIHYERLHNHNKAKHNKTVCIFLGIYCIWM